MDLSVFPFDFSSLRLWICYFFLLLGVLDILIGMIGLIRLPDIYNRLHATTKIATTGAFFVLLGILVADGLTPLGIKSIAIAVFLLMTAPVAGHVIARAAYNINVPPCDQTIFDAYCGKRQGDYCDDFDFHEGSYVYVDLDKRDQAHSFNKYKENLATQFSKEITDLATDVVETTPDTVVPIEDEVIDDGLKTVVSEPKSDVSKPEQTEAETKPVLTDLDDVISAPEDSDEKTELEARPELTEGFSESELEEKLEENPDLQTAIPEKKLEEIRENDDGNADAKDSDGKDEKS
ncbi:monovalent cation/H(+) antiporter subunit G [Methanolapillus millepedarum]|uniref:Monovalent cation/H(+) antiporter subunit G n=1 Tax=Methanolapillus millepedarum TaxID=3028296 RepID=A0AA96VFQ3_9EURY|nr:hypothetical protein MsAc7_13170 [Methanosarcinaceae archaeon Ac7]